ncbi:MAG: class I SAM-dependent methyltransferase [Alphaproteobacteria bacterium]|nr:class I SAM-dependent methyltransferase [Alphaproteobacteria bacterium]
MAEPRKKSAEFDPETVSAFNDQWRVFETRQGTKDEQRIYFDQFFSVFPWEKINKQSKGVEIGCGTGRFAQFVAPEVGHLTLVDAAPQAIEATKRTLAEFDNCTFINAPVGEAQIEPESMDFGYSFGVLHHIPDTPKAMRDSIKFLETRRAVSGLSLLPFR